MRSSHLFNNILGLDFGAVTGNLWDTDNGRDFGHEMFCFIDFELDR